jgi:hypothetical protein
MSVEELKTEIAELPESEFRILRDWLSACDQDQWDAQLERDAASGALDFLKKEALEDIDQRSPADL